MPVPPKPPPKKPNAGGVKPTAKPVPPAPKPAAAKPPLRLAVFGATGRVGRIIVQEALKRGSVVTACTRNSANVRARHANLRVTSGNVSDDHAVREAMKQQDAAVITLGAKDISRPHSVCSDGIKRIVHAAKMFNVPRIVFLGNIGLMPHASGKLQGEVSLPPFLQFVFVDQRQAWQELLESGLDWVAVCPPFMPLGEATGKYRTVVEAPLERAVCLSVEDVAHAILREVYEEAHHRARVGVAY
jgi:putative NADH-flavin reductase